MVTATSTTSEVPLSTCAMSDVVLFWTRMPPTIADVQVVPVPVTVVLETPPVPTVPVLYDEA